jgi:hypothetical protein
MSFESKVRRDRRYVFAGYGDRLATTEQAGMLWEHWDKPRISWFSGNHVGYLWSHQVSSFIGESLVASGLSCIQAEHGG